VPVDDLNDWERYIIDSIGIDKLSNLKAGVYKSINKEIEGLEDIRQFFKKSLMSI
jgi:hypothetical protein